MRPPLCELSPKRNVQIARTRKMTKIQTRKPSYLYTSFPIPYSHTRL